MNEDKKDLLEKDTSTDENKNKLSSFVNKFALSITVLIGFCLVVAANLFSTQMVLLKLEEMESKFISSSQQGSGILELSLPDYLPTIGEKDAPISIVEFADFQCPFCGEFNKTIYPHLKEKYLDTGIANFKFVNYAFLGDESIVAGEATYCAGDQNKYWEYHDMLYENQAGENENAFNLENLKKYAGDLKLDMQLFSTCMSSEKYRSRVLDETELSQYYGVNSTPTLFINGERLEGVIPLYQLDRLIDSKLEAR